MSEVFNQNAIEKLFVVLKSVADDFRYCDDARTNALALPIFPVVETGELKAVRLREPSESTADPLASSSV